MPDCTLSEGSGRRLSVSAQEYKLPAAERTDPPVDDADPLIKDDTGAAESDTVTDVESVAKGQQGPSEEGEDGWWPSYLGEYGLPSLVCSSSCPLALPACLKPACAQWPVLVFW